MGTTIYLEHSGKEQRNEKELIHARDQYLFLADWLDVQPSREEAIARLDECLCDNKTWCKRVAYWLRYQKTLEAAIDVCYMRADEYDEKLKAYSKGDDGAHIAARAD